MNFQFIHKVIVPTSYLLFDHEAQWTTKQDRQNTETGITIFHVHYRHTMLITRTITFNNLSIIMHIPFIPLNTPPC